MGLVELAGLRPRQGRGVPEIDILEARPCADLASLGGVLALEHKRQTCALNTLQVAPRLPTYLRPLATHYLDESAPWYRDLRFGNTSGVESEINPSWCDLSRRASRLAAAPRQSSHLPVHVLASSQVR